MSDSGVLHLVGIDSDYCSSEFRTLVALLGVLVQSSEHWWRCWWAF